MSTPPLPAGFVLDSPAPAAAPAAPAARQTRAAAPTAPAVPALPPGFVMDAPAGQSAVDQIPTAAQPGPAVPAAVNPPAPAGDPTMAQRAVGFGEAALTVGTGATSGTLGMIGGTLKGLAEQILSGQFGTQQAANLVEQSAAGGMQALTYAPRTAEGQRQAGVVGEVMQAALPVMPLTGELAAAGRAAATTRAARAPLAVTARAGAEGTARDVASAAVRPAEAVGAVAPGAAAGAGEAAAQGTAAAVNAAQRGAGRANASASQALQRAAEAAQPIIDRVRGTAAEGAPTPGTMGSAGAAGADIAAQRVSTAAALPVPMRLSKGQATRDFEALRFEQEQVGKSATAAGQDVRNFGAEQNKQLPQNLEAMIDATGATTTNAIEAGRAVVDQALVPAAAAAKNKYRVLYNKAEKAGEMEAPVSTAPLVAYLQENASLNHGRLAGGSLGLLQSELLRLGGAEMVDGQMVPRELSLNNVETIRRQMNNAIDSAPDNKTNMRAGVEVKSTIDQMTDGLGGDIYKEARAARARYSQLFEDNAIVRDLLATRRGTADRQVALEKVINRTILQGDRESLSMLRRTLQIAGGEPGKQAWRELQGATVRHMLDEATKGVGTDIAGRPIFSASGFDKSLRALEAGGKLEFILSKQGAQTVRDLNEIAKVVLTLPPGAVNTSHTASVIMAALTEAGINGSMTGLPVPVLSGLTVLTKYVKDRRIQQRVNEALRYSERIQRRSPASPPATPGAVQAPGSSTLQ